MWILHEIDKLAGSRPDKGRPAMPVWLPFVAAACSGFANVTLAGPHEGGTIILHANPAIPYTLELPEYCGQSGLSSCASATTEVPADPSITTVFYAFAAFPAQSEPELIGVLFGIQYDPDRLTLVDTGHCGQYEEHTSDWPLSSSGTAIGWDLAQPDHLIELHWFAAYAESGELPSTFELVEHPEQGGWFIGDWPHTPMDPVANYGTLGFGMDGYLACPDGPVPTEERSWGSVKAEFR